MLCEYAVFALCIEDQSMPHWGFLVFSVLLPPKKAKKCLLLNFLAPGFSSQNKSEQPKAYYKLLLVTGDSWRVRHRSKRNRKTVQPQLFFSVAEPSLGITVTLCLVGFYFLGGSLTYGVRQHLSVSALCCLVSNFLKHLSLNFWKWTAKFRHGLILFKVHRCPVCGQG